jgi:hypothetical protein
MTLVGELPDPKWGRVQQLKEAAVLAAYAYDQIYKSYRHANPAVPSHIHRDHALLVCERELARIPDPIQPLRRPS